MIAVSDSFKKAIKNDTREIHGYVEIKYQDKNFDTEVTKIPTSSSLTSTNGIVQDNKILQKYASLENNYTLLDGSFMVWNENNLLKSGYISEDVFEDISDNEIIITNNDTTVSTKGITIYFKENLPFSFTVTITNTDNEQIIDTVTNNQSYVYQYIFPTEMYISTVSITINDIEFPKNRLRIASVDFNLSDCYEGEELVSFEVTEELDLMFDSIPIGTCTVKLNNYPDEGKSKFDVLNPKGIVSYLNNNVIIKPYIGVLTDLNGIEYVPMGIFYLKDWTSDNDGNITLNSENLISKLQQINISSDGDFLTTTMSIQTFNNYFHSWTGYDFNLTSNRISYMHCGFLKTFNLFEWIKCFIVADTVSYDSQKDKYYKQIFHITRDNIVATSNLLEESIDKISRNQLKQDVDYKIKSRINEVSIKAIGHTNQVESELKALIDETHTLENDVEYMWYKWDEECFIYNFSYSVVSGSAVVECIDYNAFLAYVKITGVVGSEVSIIAKGYPALKTSDKTLSFKNDLENGDKLEFNYDQYWNFILSYSAGPILAGYCLNEDKKYKAVLQTTGDPSLEIGDTISVQTRYDDINDGYKDIIITKQQFTYNGGLECNLEGVGN